MPNSCDQIELIRSSANTNRARVISSRDSVNILSMIIVFYCKSCIEVKRYVSRSESFDGSKLWMKVIASDSSLVSERPSRILVYSALLKHCK